MEKPEANLIRKQPKKRKKIVIGKWIGGKRLLITSVTLLSCLFMFNYKYYEILKLHVKDIDTKQSNQLFWTRLFFGKTRSRLTGKFLSLNIPPGWRLTIYNAVIKILNINREEIKYPLESFKSISELFSRYIREETRPIDAIGTYSVVSPCDSVITDFGEVTSDYIQNVKGLKLYIKDFLGENLKKKYSDGSTTFYYAIFYLSPSKYHHFHSPTTFTCHLRRHISGETFPLFSGMFKFINNILNINERVVLSGEWAGGNMLYTAVSAYNVGNIHIINDNNLVTNKYKMQLSYLGGDIDTKIYNSKHIFEVGDELGEFKLGSSVVLFFENKKNFTWNIKLNQSIKVGQRIGNLLGEQLKNVNKFIKFKE